MFLTPRSRASPEQMALRDLKQIPVCEDSAIFLSLSLSFSPFALKAKSKKKGISEVEVCNPHAHLHPQPLVNVYMQALF
jgi:hypothetical protein